LKPNKLPNTPPPPPLLPWLPLLPAPAGALAEAYVGELPLLMSLPPLLLKPPPLLPSSSDMSSVGKQGSSGHG
jgi:hypothetical protein